MATIVCEDHSCMGVSSCSLEDKYQYFGEPAAFFFRLLFNCICVMFIKSKHVHQVKLCASWVLITGLPSTPSQGKWLTKTLRPGSRVGADPNLVKYSIWKPLQTDLEAGGLFLVPVTTNLIDIIWEDRPSVPCNVIQPLPVKYTGKREWFTSLYQLLHPNSVVNDVEIFQMSITEVHC